MAGDRPPHINAPPLLRTAGKQKSAADRKNGLPRLYAVGCPPAPPVPRTLTVSRVLGLGDCPADETQLVAGKYSVT